MFSVVSGKLFQSCISLRTKIFPCISSNTGKMKFVTMATGTLTRDWCKEGCCINVYPTSKNLVCIYEIEFKSPEFKAF